MKKNLLIFFFVFLLLKVNAQSSISGHITDAGTHESLPGVNVIVNDLSVGTVSNKDGNYELKNLPEGTLLITFSYVGYQTVTKKITTQNKAIRMNIEMKPMVIQGQEVVITGSFTGTQHENTVAINALDTKDITRVTQPTFMASITSVPGVSMISKGPGVGTPVIRGLSLSNVLVLNKGIPMANFQFSEDHPYLVNGLGIGRVEIIKGPASLMYGSGAVGGIINMVEEPAAREGSIEGNANMQFFSNTLGTLSSAEIKGNHKGFVWSGGAQVNSNADYRQGGKAGVAYNTRFNTHSAALSAGIIKKIGSFRMFYDYHRSKLGMAVPPALAIVHTRSRKNNVWYQDLADHLLVSKNKIFLGHLKVNADFSFQDNHRMLQGSSVTPVKKLVDMRLKTFTYRIKNLYHFSESTKAFVGIQGMSQSNKNGEAPQHVIPDARLNDFSVFSMVRHNFSSLAILEAGIRFDHRHVTVPVHTAGLNNSISMPRLDKNFNNVSASVGTILHLSKKALLRFNLASAFRSPNIAELTQNGLHGNRYEIGDSHLKNQQNLEADLGFHLHTTHTTIAISAFYNYIDNYIFLSPTADSLTDGTKVYRYQQTPSHLLGGEAGIHIHPVSVDWLHLKANYQYVYARKNAGGYLPLIPANKVHFEVMVRKNKWKVWRTSFIKVSCDYVFAQNHPSDFETATPGYFLLDAGMGTDLKVGNQVFSFSLMASNLLNKQYFDHLSTLKDVNIYNPGRNISLNIRIPFGIKQ
jgi:iron complex outermembrane receptor protein